jgi:hypothetical protein
MKITTNLWYLLIFAIYCSLCNIYDVWSTRTGLAMGGVELNPFLFNNVYFKLSAVPLLFIVTMLIWWWIGRRQSIWTPKDVKQGLQSKKLMSYVWIVLSILYTALVVNNTLVIIKLMETVRI